MEIAREWNVSGVPTVLLFKDEELKERIVGNAPRADIGEILERNIQRDILQESSGGESDTSSALLCGVSEQENSGERSS
jgi:hypothetical protein